MIAATAIAGADRSRGEPTPFDYREDRPFFSEEPNIFCFPDTATADAFRNRFGGVRMTYAPRESHAEDFGSQGC